MNFKVWTQDLNHLYQPELGDTSYVVAETHSIYEAQDSVNRYSKHDHATWVTCDELGDRVVDMAFVLNYEDAIKAQAEAYNDQATNRAYHYERARMFLFQMIGDGCPEDEVDCEPLACRVFEVKCTHNLGADCWANNTSVTFTEAYEAKIFASTIPNDKIKVVGIHVRYL